MMTFPPKTQHTRTLALTVLLLVLSSCGGSTSLETVPGKYRLVGKLVAQSVTVGATHVYAVSAETGSVDRVLAALDVDGRFTLDLPLGRSYVIGVIDATRIGAAMVRGYLEFEGMHALPIEIEGAFDLGAVSQTDGSRWASELASLGGLLTVLGVGAATIDSLASQDGLALRLLNPDVDGNGILDLDETGKAFLSEVDAFFEARVAGSLATIDDIRNGAVAAIDALVFDTNRTSPMVATYGYFTAANTETSAVFRFIDAEGSVMSILPDGAAELDSDTDGTFPAGAWTGGPEYQALELGLLATSELPRGEVRITFSPSDTALVFFPMLPQLAADLSQGYEHAFASIFLTEDSTAGPCATTPCLFTQLGFEWKVMTSAGVRNATATDLRALISSRGAKFKFTIGSTDAVEMAIPSNAIEGSIAWIPANAMLGTASESSFTSLDRSMLCNSRVEHLDRFGLKYEYRIGRALLATGCP